MKRTGFTLVELLVVIGIIGVLIAMILPAVQSVRVASRRVNCSNQVRQIAIAVHSFESSNRVFPSGINHFDAAQDELPSLSWLAQILPMIEQTNLWNNVIRDFELQPFPHSHSSLQRPVLQYGCPSDPSAGRPHFTHFDLLISTTSYVGVSGTNREAEDGVFFLDSRTTFSEITDGSSQTLMVGERPPSPDYWYGWWYTGFGFAGSGIPDMLLGVAELNYWSADQTTYLESCPEGPYQFEKGNNEQCDTLHFWSLHPGGANFAFCDGSVQFLRYGMQEIMQKLATRTGGEIANDDQF